MFTGLVQAVGSVAYIAKRGAADTSCLRLPPGARAEKNPPSLQVYVDSHLPYWPSEGGSVAIDGVCLTHRGRPLLEFDLSDETLARTTLGNLREGSRVNVELALRAGDPIGGHFVQGHVDGVGEFLGSSGEENRFRAPDGGEKFLADKGSITLAGVSLTVIRPAGPEFSVALVPHTLSATTLGELRPGDAVNVEYDVLARYLLAGRIF
ncbi:MAG: riboflavin synthase [Armatimonadota bacterium]|nr:riboflavin synthase [Armatimonadota bacterium]